MKGPRRARAIVVIPGRGLAIELPIVVVKLALHVGLHRVRDFDREETVLRVCRVARAVNLLQAVDHGTALFNQQVVKGVRPLRRSADRHEKRYRQQYARPHNPASHSIA